MYINIISENQETLINLDITQVISKMSDCHGKPNITFIINNLTFMWGFETVEDRDFEFEVLNKYLTSEVDE